MDSGTSKHITLNKNAFNRDPKHGDIMIVELGNDATRPIIRLGCISFCMPLGEILELDDVLYVSGSTKSLLSVSCMTNLQCITEFDGL